MDSRAQFGSHGARVLVTGATGFIGRRVTSALLDAGREVGVLVREQDRLPAALTGRVAETFVEDLARPGGLARTIARWQPEILFNLAGYGVAKDERDDRLAQRLNADLPGEAADAMARLEGDWPGARIVHVGSALEYGVLDGPPDEGAVARPSTTYGRTKLAGTEALARATRARGLPCITFRLFTVFGPDERPGRLLPTLLAARGGTGRIALSAGEQARDFAFVDDVARVIAEADLVWWGGDRILDAGFPLDAGAINVATGQLTRVRDFVAAAARVLGIDASRLGFGDLPALPEEMPHQPVPIQRLRAISPLLVPRSDLERALRVTLAAAPAAENGRPGGGGQQGMQAPPRESRRG